MEKIIKDYQKSATHQIKQLEKKNKKLLDGIRKDIEEHNKAIDSLVEDYQRRVEWDIDEFKRQINKIAID